jgi:hypothetical protein
MMRLTAALFILACLSFVAERQDHAAQGHVLEFLWREATETAERRVVLLAILSDSGPLSTSPIAQQLRRAGVPLASPSALPAHDTLVLRTTLPASGQDRIWRVGVEFLVCRAGRVLGDRTLQHLRCRNASCVRGVVFSPHERLELGACEGGISGSP